MRDCRSGHLISNFFVNGADGAGEVVYADSHHSLMCVDGANLNIWDIYSKKLTLVPIENFDGHLQVHEEDNELYVFSDHFIKVLDLGDLHLKRTVRIRPDDALGFFRSKDELNDGGMVLTWSDSAKVFNRTLQLVSAFPTKNDFLLADRENNLLVLYDRQQHSLIFKNMLNGLVEREVALPGPVYNASLCGKDHILVNFSLNKSLLVNVKDGSTSDPSGFFPAANLVQYRYANRKWLICKETIANYDHVTVLDANSFQRLYADSCTAGSFDNYDVLLGEHQFVFSYGYMPPGSHAATICPEVLNLDEFNLADNAGISLFPLAAAYRQYFLAPPNGVKKTLADQIFRHYRHTDPDAEIVFSSKLHYIISKNFYTEKALYQCQWVRPDSVSSKLVTDLGWKNDVLAMAAFSQDEKHLACWKDSDLYVLETASGQQLAKKHFSFFTTNNVTYAGDDYLFTSNSDSLLFYFNYAARNWKKINMQDVVSAIREERPGIYLVSCWNGVFELDCSTGKLTPRLARTSVIDALSDTAAQKEYLLLSDGSVASTDFRSGEVATFKSPAAARNLVPSFQDMGIGNTNFQHFMLSAGGHWLLTHTRDNVIRVWDTRSRQLQFETVMSKVHELVLNEQSGTLIGLADNPYTPSQNVLNIYDFIHHKLLLSDSLLSLGAKQHPPAAVAGRVKVPLRIIADGKEQAVNLLDFNRTISSDLQFNKLLITYSSVGALVDLHNACAVSWKTLSGNPFLTADGAYLVSDSSGTVISEKLADGTYTKIKLAGVDAIISGGYAGNQLYFLTNTYRMGSGNYYGFLLFDSARQQVLGRRDFAYQTPAKVIVSADQQYQVFCSGDIEKEDSVFIYRAGSGQLLQTFTGKQTSCFFTGNSHYLVCLFHDAPSVIYDLSKGTASRVVLDEFHACALPQSDLIVSEGKIIDPSNDKTYYPNFKFYTGCSRGMLYGVNQADEAAVYDTRSDTTRSFAFQQTGPFNLAVAAPGGKYLLTLGYDTRLNEWDLLTGKLIRQSVVGFDFNRDIYFNADTSFILLSNTYQGAQYSLAPLRPSISFTAGAHGQLDYFLPDGSYFANKEDLGAYFFNYRGRLFSFEQFDLHFNRPDKLLNAFGAGDPELRQLYEDAYMKRCANLGISPRFSFTGSDVPQIELINQQAIALKQVAADHAELEVRGKDEQGKGLTLKVMVNNNPLVGYPQQLASSVTASVNVPLSVGINKIAVSCVNAKGISSLTRTLSINYQPKAIPEVKTYFIGIGISQYQDKSRTLHFAGKDIADIQQALQAKYPDLVSYTVTEAQATADNIRQLLAKLKTTHVDDRVIIAYSGHGLGNGQDFYLSTYDCDFNKPAAKAFNFDELSNALAAAPARKKLVLIDACNSGAADKDKSVAEDPFNAAFGTSSFDLMQDLFADITAANGAVIISAARSSAFADEGKSNGILTQCLLECLQKGLERVGEIKDYIIKTVPAITHGHQQPVARQDNAAYDWSL